MSDSVLDNINEFYKLKNKYENDIKKNKNKILNNPTLSWKERQNEFKKLKPKCINCKRPGGSAFLTKFNEDSGFRELRSFCMAVKQCNLNIVIQLGRVEILTDSIIEIEDSIRESKKKIINDKNQLLFNYIDSNQAVSFFEKEKVEISEWSSLLELYLENYILLTDSEETKIKLKNYIERSYEFIQQIKEAIHQFKITDDTQFVKDAVNVYITSLKPLLDETQKLKYKENMVWYNDNSNTYHLIQRKNNIISLQSGENDNKTIHFNVGFSGLEKEKEKNDVFSESKKSPVLKDDIIGKPTFEENNIVKWSNKEYQQTWDKLSPRMKDALLTDKEWLQEFIESCTSLRILKKPCLFISPSNLILPPQIIHIEDDGKEKEEYDFGNKIYNELFNRFDASYQNTLLKLYSTKDGVKNYKLLENLLNDFLEKELGFTKGYI